MSRCVRFVSDSDDDNADDFSLAAAGVSDGAMPEAPGFYLGKDPLSAGSTSQPHPSSVNADRRSLEGVPLPELNKVSSTRRNLSQLFGSGPTPLARGAMPDSSRHSSATQAAASTHAANGAAVETGSGATEAPDFFAPQFNYDDGSGTGTAGLITAEHAVVQAYRDSLYSGTCMLALCVPLATASAVATPTASPPSAAVRRHLREQQEAVAALNTAAGGPTLLLISGNRQVLCRVALDATDVVFSSDSLQLRQDTAQPQYLTFFGVGCAGIRGSSSSERSAGGGGGSGCWWTCMFPDREKASRFLVSTYTIAQYAAALAQRSGTSCASVPSVRTLPALPRFASDKAVGRAAGAPPDVVRPDVPTTIFWQTWALRRVSQETLYCVPGSCVEAVLPSAPRTVTATDATLWDTATAALVGMRKGESRLVFLTPEVTSLQQRKSGAHSHRSNGTGRSVFQRPVDTPAVVYMTCLQVASSLTGTPEPATPSGVEDLVPPLPPTPPPAPATATAAATTSVSVSVPPPAAEPSQGTGTFNPLLQQLLLHFLQQQPLVNASASQQGAAQQVWGSIEHTLARVQAQLGSLYEKIDRLDIETKLQRNNTELERIMRKVAGRAPQEEVAIEDSLKGREELLATVERYRHKFEEANDNYQRALEAMGRLSDRAQALERDLHLQQEIWAQQRKDEAEQMRLRLVERDARHRDELERVGEERYAAGRSDGHVAGYREGRQATLLEVEGTGTSGDGEGSVVMQWREKLMVKDQEVIALKTALQDARFRHDRDRRQLRAEIDVLTELNDKLKHLQANADVCVPSETMQQQCKRIKRTLNAVYSQVEGQMLQLSSLERRAQSGGRQSLQIVGHGDGVKRAGGASDTDGGVSSGVVAVDDALAIVMLAIRSEAQVAVTEIRTNEARRTAANAELRARTLARRGGQHPTSASYDGYRPSSSALLVAYGVKETVGGPEVEHSSLVKRTSTPPPLPPEHTAASQEELAALAAALLPKVVQTASMKSSAAEVAEGAAEAKLDGDRLLSEGTFVSGATAALATTEELFYSETGTKWANKTNQGSDSVARQLYDAPAHADPCASAAASVLSTGVARKGVDAPDVSAGSLHSALSLPTTCPIPENKKDLLCAGDGKAPRWDVGDSANDGFHTFSTAAIAAAAAVDGAAARASAGFCSSISVGDEVHPVPTLNTISATITTTSNAPTQMGADSPLRMTSALVAQEGACAVDMSKASIPRCSTGSSSSLSTPAQQSRMATRLSPDAPASPPPPLSALPSGGDSDDGTRHGDEAVGDRAYTDMREAAWAWNRLADTSRQALPLVPPVLPNDTSLVGVASDLVTPSCDSQPFSSPSTSLRDWQGSRLFSSPPSTGGG